MPSFFRRLKGSSNTPARVLRRRPLAGDPPTDDEASTAPSWSDAYTRETVEPEEVQALIAGCTLELKARGATAPDSLTHSQIVGAC